MKKIGKLIFIIIIFIFITGCTGKANIVVNHDGTVKETVDINEINGNIIYGNFSVNESLELFLKKYSQALIVSGYNSNKYNNKYDSGVTLEKTHENICDFANNTIFSQYLYKTISCEETEFYYELYNVGDVVQNSYEDYKEMPDDRTLFIKLPVAAEEQNADEIKGNTYIWKYNKDTKDKDFYLKISKTRLEEYKNEYLEKKVKREKRDKIIKVSCVFLVFIVIGIISFILYKKYKKNNFDY